MSVLLITNKADVTTDFIVRELRRKDIQFYRLNTEDIGRFINLSFNLQKEEYLLNDTQAGVTINLSNIKAVYFRRPEVRGYFDEVSKAEANFLHSEILFTLEGLYKILKNCFWVNNVDDIRQAENKIYQLMLAKEIGFKLPSSIVTNQPEHAVAFYNENHKSCIIKPVRSGLIEDEHEEGVIFTSKLELTIENAQRISVSPVFLQKLIQKSVDLRITIVGKQLFAASIDSQHNEDSRVDWRKSTQSLAYTSIELPNRVAEKCFDLTRRLNLNFGAIDMILDQENDYIFLEINPNGQWAWLERQLDFPIAQAITTLIIEKAT